MLKINDKAPDFKAKDHNGNSISLSNYLGNKYVVLFFYPKDFTPGCTAEACAFRDAYEDFLDAGAEVIGISGDGDASHQNFAKQHKLPYPLLPDTDKKIRKAYDIPTSLLGMVTGRITYLVNKEGLIKYAYRDNLNPVAHIKAILNLIKN